MPTAGEVLACPDFDKARAKYPEVIRLALSEGPPDAVFRANWAATAEYHGSLRNFIAKAAAAAASAASAAAEAPPADPFPPPAPAPRPEGNKGGVCLEEVLACRSFDAAKERYPKIIDHALKGGYPENVFRDHWSPKAQYHDSLKKVLTKAVAALTQEAKEAAGDKLILTRHSDGEFWGFLVGKKMKVVDVHKDGPADRAGLKKGTYVLLVETSRGMMPCVKPGDAYGPPGCPDTSITLTISDSPGDPAALPRPAVTMEQYTDRRTGDWTCPSCHANVFASKTFCFKCGAAKPVRDVEGQPAKKRDRPRDNGGYADVGFAIPQRSSRSRSRSPEKHKVSAADRVALDYIMRKKQEAEQRKGSNYLPKGGLAQQRAAARFDTADGGGPQLDRRPGDWTCPSCRAHVFASKATCFNCGAAKPAPAAAK